MAYNCGIDLLIAKCVPGCSVSAEENVINALGIQRLLQVCPMYAYLQIVVFPLRVFEKSGASHLEFRQIHVCVYRCSCCRATQTGTRFLRIVPSTSPSLWLA